MTRYLKNSIIDHAMNRDFEAIQDEVNPGNVNLPDIHLNSVLGIAARYSNVNMVKYLVECGANINFVNSKKCTALCGAARTRNWDVVRYLLECGANRMIQDIKGNNCLHYIADISCGHEREVGHKLIEKFCVGNEYTQLSQTKNNYGRIPMECMTEGNDINTFF